MLLLDLVGHYTENHVYGVSSGHAKQLRYSVAIFAGWLGRQPELEDLRDDQLSAYVDWLRERYRPDTARTQRGNLLCLWRHAFAWQLVDQEPRRVRRLRMPPRRPAAWSPIEIWRLAEEAGRVRGVFRGSVIRRGPNLRALVLCAWATGYRLGDLLRLAPDDVGADRIIRIDQHKTGVPAVRMLDEQTWLAVACTVADDPERARIWSLGAGTYQAWVRRLQDRVAVRPGSIKWIRRAVGTVCESQRGDGSAMLGHTDRATLRFYVDLSQLVQPLAAPSLAELAQSEEKRPG